MSQSRHITRWRYVGLKKEAHSGLVNFVYPRFVLELKKRPSLQFISPCK